MQSQTPRGLVVILIDSRGLRGEEPVPMKYRNTLSLSRRGVPAKEVIVEDADLAGSMLVANDVVIGLGEGNGKQSENQKTDSQRSATSASGASSHVETLPEGDRWGKLTVLS
jgi:hypothetical protein